ncbi:glycogen debranching protein GlgX [bacterium]|nr:glycogen debranching protein GlgX [bacterium]
MHCPALENEMKLEHRTNKKLSKGESYPQGAVVREDGIQFAIFSSTAEAVYLLLYDDPGDEPTDSIRIPYKTEDIWHVVVHGVGHGQLYAYRVKGSYIPEKGLRFNHHKLLIDPYARALTGPFSYGDPRLLGYNPDDAAGDLSFSEEDNGRLVPKCVALANSFDWEDDKHPGIPCEQLIVYEVHVRGFTRDRSARVHAPGTFKGFIEKIPHLKRLGINAVELLPVQESYNPGFLAGRGLTDYWGYNTIGFFAPGWRFGTGSSYGCQVDEFKELVKALHKEGIEIILDVVYNHTGEGSEMGPSLCFRGIDNPAYYQLAAAHGGPARGYVNETGTGNTINIGHPQVLRLIIDSLRYWVREMHVDGFRFDLATVLGKQNGRLDVTASFFRAVSSDPMLSRIKLIAEPWDLMTYGLGQFPAPWMEWNGRFRDTARRFIRGDYNQVRDLGGRVTGSEDLFRRSGRQPCHSVNFITCHDGFTLYDLFSYNWKHNEDNLEENRDGTNDNYSWNCGREGRTSLRRVLFMRMRLIKNSICLLLFSAGTPMILGGDEMLRTQHGNNNAYCQDNDLSWFDWDRLTRHGDIHEFFRKAIAFRKRFLTRFSKTYVAGFDFNGNNVPDIQWFGRNLQPPSWDDYKKRTIAFQLDGSETASDKRQYFLFFIFNSYRRAMVMKLPQHHSLHWHRIVDTAEPPGKDFLEADHGTRLKQQEFYKAGGRSVVVLIAR